MFIRTAVQIVGNFIIGWYGRIDTGYVVGWMDGRMLRDCTPRSYLGKLELFFVSFSSLAVVAMKLTVFRNVTPCNLTVKNLSVESVTFVLLSLSTSYKLHRV
jgi:hypothetical protein